jgi:hypothetical protein
MPVEPPNASRALPSENDMPRITLPATALRRLAAVTAGAVMLATSACGDSPMATQNGRLTLLLTDAPGDFKKAVVTVSEIYLQGAGGRVVLLDQPVTTDLLTLANSTAELVKDATVPAGSYQELRFVVTGGYIEVDNGGGASSIYASAPNYAGLPAGAQVTGELQMPSFAQSGIKVKLPGDGGVTLGSEQKVVLVDFDVSRSFGRAAGNSGRWVMSPVLEATEFSASGSAVARVRLASPAPTLPTVNGKALALDDLSAVLTNAAGARETVALTDADNDGVFEGRFRYVAPGAFQMDLSGPTGVALTTTETRPTAVTVASSAEAGATFTVTGATYTAP